MGHEWLLSVVVPISEADINRLGAGERLVLRKVDVTKARGSAVLCGRCRRPILEARGKPCAGQSPEVQRGSGLVLPAGVHG